jgi:two-component system, chemotaxis family, sensor kinase Cph1
VFVQREKPLTEAVTELTECDREPIHIPGSIQPHGVMLVAESTGLIVRYVGGDAQRLLGIDAAVNRPLAGFVGGANAETAALVTKTAAKRAFIGTIEKPDGSDIDITAHLSGNYLILELEPKTGPEKSSAELLGALEVASATFDQAPTLKALCDIAAIEFRKLTGYDRVMVYRFLDEGAGTVLAENRRPDLHSFMNHHFPASDIPQQARALYIRNILRVIPDVNYVAAPLQPEWQASAPLDMSDSVLRSVSPIHLQYLRNMGVAASASISIVKDGVLWGLIACHNQTPRAIPYDVRAACRTLASNLSRQIATREETDAYRERLRLRGAVDDIIASLSGHGSLEQEIAHHLDELSRLVSGDGFALVRGDTIELTGACPSQPEVRQLADWLMGKSAEAIFATSQLAIPYPAAKSFESLAAGVLALVLSVEERWLLIWFRAEEIQTVNWAGNPHKGVDLKPGETLNPRTSFEAWQETVQGRARRWTLAEMEAAGRIRHDLIELRQNQRLKELNRQLTETVAEKNLLLDQKQFLIGEVNHRVQNSLQLVSSFLSFQAREKGDDGFTEAVDEARRRIMAVSLLHRSLYRGSDIGVTDAGRYIEELCETLIASIGAEWKPYFALSLGPVMLPIDRVIPLGLVVTELIININKYAYGGAAGPVEIGLSEHAAKFRLVVADKGRGRTSGRRGFGTRMMAALVTQLGGELESEDNLPGLRVVLSAPVVLRP